MLFMDSLSWSEQIPVFLFHYWYYQHLSKHIGLTLDFIYDTPLCSKDTIWLGWVAAVGQAWPYRIRSSWSTQSLHTMCIYWELPRASSEHLCSSSTVGPLSESCWTVVVSNITCVWSTGDNHKKFVSHGFNHY